MKHQHEEQDTAIDGLTECLLRVITRRSVYLSRTAAFGRIPAAQSEQ